MEPDKDELDWMLKMARGSKQVAPSWDWRDVVLGLLLLLLLVASLWGVLWAWVLP